MGESKDALSTELLQTGEIEEGYQMMDYDELVQRDFEIGIVDDGLRKANEKIRDAVTALEGASDFSDECKDMVKDFELAVKKICVLLEALKGEAFLVEDEIARIEKEGLVNA